MLVTGGMLRLPAMSLVGDLSAGVLRRRAINKGFLGARGLSLERGLMDLNPEEVRIKHEMAGACEQVIGIFDGTKWHRSALLSFVAADRVDAIITDSARPPAEVVEAWRARGVGGHRPPSRRRATAPGTPARDLRRTAARGRGR